MDFSKITPSWLKKQRYKLVSPYGSSTIEGVILKELKVNLDGRGDLIELWSQPWVKKEDFLVPKHIYQSVTDFGVIKCWHLHKIHTDQIVVTSGKLQLVLVDLRSESSSFAEVNPIFMGIKKPRLVKVPPGVLHGWKALGQPETTVLNFASEIYDIKDEYRFPWDCILKDVWEPKNG